MLVLSRKPKQRVFIGDGICVTVLEIRGNLVRIGLQAPEEVLILREEIAPQPAPSLTHRGETDRSDSESQRQTAPTPQQIGGRASRLLK